jgi:hypothetical protein
MTMTIPAQRLQLETLAPPQWARGETEERVKPGHYVPGMFGG